TMQGINNASAFETFDRLSLRVEQLEAEAEAQAAIAGELTGDTLAQKFKALEHDHGVDDALAELKAKMGLGLPPVESTPLLPPGSQSQPRPTGTAEGHGASASVIVEEPVPVGAGGASGATGLGSDRK